MQINSNQERLLSITEKLDKIIAIARPKYKEIPASKEVITKLTLASAIALLATYLIISNWHFGNLSQNYYLVFLYVFTLFLIALANIFHLIDYFYQTPLYTDKTLFENNRDLFTVNLAEFSEEEIDLAHSNAENIVESLFDKISSNIVPNVVLFVILCWGLILN